MTKNGFWTAGLFATALVQLIGCGPAYLGPPPSMNPPPARLLPLPQQPQIQQPPLMLPPGGSSSLQQVPSVPADQIFAPQSSRKEPRYHTVREGDTLSRIAQQYGVTAQDLMKANAWDQPPLLQPGYMIQIP